MDNTLSPDASYREEIYEFVRKNIEGPVSEDEVIDDRPSKRYSAGILFHKFKYKAEVDDEPPSSSQSDPETPDLDCGESDDAINPVFASASFYPSSMAVRFALKKGSHKVRVSLSYGRYSKLSSQGDGHTKVKVACNESQITGLDNEDIKPYITVDPEGNATLKQPFKQAARNLLLDKTTDPAVRNIINSLYNLYAYSWVRRSVNYEQGIDIGVEPVQQHIPDQSAYIDISTRGNTSDDGASQICTLAIVNNAPIGERIHDDKCMFQVHFSIEIHESPGFLNLNRIMPKFVGDDYEQQSLNLLYRNRGVYALAYGTSAHWDKREIKTRGFISKIGNAILPRCKVPDVDFEPPDSSGLDLSITTMAFSSQENVFQNLELLTNKYEEWINGLGGELASLEESHRLTAERHLDLCRGTLERMRGGISALRSHEQTFRAFQDANKAMLMQRRHRRLQDKEKTPAESCKMPDSYSEEEDSWRPFQIAFMLMNIKAVSDHDSDERDIVDLIWFPTGGGKTEAYLGLIAFTILYRRMTKDNGGGTAAIMRYTMRLLTAQQFDRACTLICACEILRRQSQGVYGEEKITIGLWIGAESSPNHLKDAEDELRALQQSDNYNNPFQILKCPWCGTIIKDGDKEVGYEIASKPKRFSIGCLNRNCDFCYLQAENNLPILVVDEDIYNAPPTLLFGTVDKFALLSTNKETSSIFALDKGNTNLPPSLIIQDELHLISGPLGSIVGMYEVAVDILCSRNNVKPKIIASTATISKADDQCRALYGRPICQFPAPGINAEDSFFARELKQSNGRLYVGVMPSGRSSSVMRAQLMSSCFKVPDFINQEEEVALEDNYWTQVIYHGSMKDLGLSQSIFNDAFRSFCQNLESTYGRERRRKFWNTKVMELTSRTKNVKSMLDRLQTKKGSAADDDQSIHILLTTNMISVGVDIDRLNIMTIINQPKTTGEYIQASSRVGRKQAGIVFVSYSAIRNRDRSHYEQFQQYHQSLYKHVEPSSVTPFSVGSVDKAFNGMLIALLRHKIGLVDKEDLSSFDWASDTFGRLKDQLLERVRETDSEPSIMSEAVAEFIERVEMLKRDGRDIAFTNAPDGCENLIDGGEYGGPGEFEVLRSMRDTDTECEIRITNQ